MTISDHFASVFDSNKASAMLAQYEKSSHLSLPTFSLTTSSLRHLTRWFERLEDITDGRTRQHGNFFSDPASIGLVDSNTRTLTEAGSRFLNHRNLKTEPAAAEFQLLKILYFDSLPQTSSVKTFLKEKRENAKKVLVEFAGCTGAELFLSRPQLLVIAELIHHIDGALKKFASLPQDVLIEFSQLHEAKFMVLCDGGSFPKGLSKLCKKIASEYTRAEERRLHYLVSLCLLELLGEKDIRIPEQLVVPKPYSNLISVDYLIDHCADYTDELNIWAEGNNCWIVNPNLLIASGQLRIRPQELTITPRLGRPVGLGILEPDDGARIHPKKRANQKAVRQADTNLGRFAEDYVEAQLLRPHFGSNLIRVGHTQGENYSLPDNLLPGADFYVLGSSNSLVEFIEIKSVSMAPPVVISFTRGEYFRAIECAKRSIPYQLILFNPITKEVIRSGDVASALRDLSLSEVIDFGIEIDVK